MLAGDAVTAQPHGLGFFLDSHDMQQAPADTVARLLAAGATWAGVLILSVDGRRQPLARVRAICAALRAADVVPWLFAFPPPGETRKAADWIETVAADVACPRVLLDLEPFDENGDKRIAPSEDWDDATIGALVGDLIVAGLAVIVSLYTRPRWLAVDWDRVAPGVHVALQAYDRWESRETLLRALRRFPRRPVSVTGETYKGDLARLRRCLAVATEFAREHGCLSIWSLHTTSSAEAAALLEWALVTWGARAA